MRTTAAAATEPRRRRPPTAAGRTETGTLGVVQAAGPFLLDELGTLQFERLCVELLQLETGALETRPWGLSLLLRDGAAVPYGGRLDGPTLVLVAWIRHGAVAPTAPLRLRHLVEDALGVWEEKPARSLLLLTNVADADGVVPDDVQAAVLGPDELWRLFAAAPEVRFRVPSALGVADLDALIPEEVSRRSTADVAAAAELARVFVPTRPYLEALRVLRRHRFAVLTGPPEMGKTAIARMIGLAALTDGWEVHECIRPDELWSRFARDRRQVFVADDAFGSTEYRPEAAERWAVELDGVLRAMDDRHWLVWTSRPAPLKAGLGGSTASTASSGSPSPRRSPSTRRASTRARRRSSSSGTRRAPRSPSPRRRSCRRRAGASSPTRTSPRSGSAVSWTAACRSSRAAAAQTSRRSSPPRFASRRLRWPPRTARSRRSSAPCCSRCSTRHRARCRNGSSRRPSAATRRPGSPTRRRRSSTGSPTTSSATSSPPPSRGCIRAGATSSSTSSRTTRPRGARSCIACGSHGAALALSTAGGAAGERSLPLLRDDADWDATADRLAELVPELEPPDVTLLLTTLAEAHAVADGAARAELDALAAELLGRLARVWSAGRGGMPVGLLAAWLALASELPERPQLPALAATWIELASVGPVDLRSAVETTAFDDWTVLAELLRDHAPELLRGFGFPDSCLAELRSYIGSVETALLDAKELETADTVTRTLMRIGRLAPGLAFPAYDAADRLRARRAARESAAAGGELVELRPLSPELERLLDQPLASRNDDESIVARVLRDL